MLTLFSPAKINLFLRVLGKRADGYHELASLFQTIDLSDSLTFSFSKDDVLTCSDPGIPCDASNLVHKAVSLFRQKTGLRFGITVHLDKKIPIQAGLGGGSSNAATTLWALNALHGNKIPIEELQTWSAEIGSDIPFFFSYGTAYCTGRGEHVRNLPPPNLASLAVLKPKEGLSTPAIYRALDLRECSAEDPEHLLQSFYAGKPIFINDLEKPAFQLCPELKTFKQKLMHEGHNTLFMTGSGTALISVGKDGQKPICRQEDSWFSC